MRGKGISQGGLLLLLAIVALAAYYIGANPSILSGQVSQVTINQPAPEVPTTDQQTQPVQMPRYQISTVDLYIMDKLNPNAGISGVEVEVLEVPEVYTQQDLINIASNPDRDVVDEDTATDVNGLAEFTAGKIFVGKPYLYSVRGDSSVYDYLEVRTIPVPSTQFMITSYSFPEKIYVYKVGSWSDILPNGATTTGWDAVDTTNNILTFNVTGKSGLQFATVDITIAEADAGKALKAPVLQMHYTDGQEFPSGAITSLYFTKSTGSDFGLTGRDYVSYIDSETPIELTGDLTYNSKEGVYYATVADSAVYTMKITFDADTIQAGDELNICLDDLGDYRGKDKTTRDVKAPAECLTIQTVS